MTDALAAALLASQRGQQQFDPSANSRRFAQQLMMQGASTAPVAHPVEGIARALTGGLGGFFEGQEERKQEDKNKRLIEGLTGAMSEKDPAKRMEILKSIGPDSSGVLAPFLGSMLSQQVADERKNKILDTKLDASGLPGAPSAQPGLGGGQQGPLTIDINKAPPSGTVAPGGFSNNTGNIRATPGVSFPGQGAPQNGFMTFDTPQSGVNAQAANFAAYVKANPTMTVAQALAKWAPPSENNTAQYISTIAENSGVNPGLPLSEVMKDPGAFATLLDAQTRIEKGGMPAGATADTFIAAAGGQPMPGQPQVAQGSSFQQTPVPAQSVPGALPQTQAAPQTQVAQAPPQAPAVTTMPEISPAAQTLMQQAEQARRGGDRERALALVQKAQEAQATYVQERAKTGDTRAFDQQEFDRRQAIEKQNKDPTEFQGKSGTYADRMVQNNAILDQVDKTGTSGRGRFFEAVPGGNLAQSQEYRKFQTAKDNWIAANARQESGAAIGAQEYANMDKQYFPQPNDGPDIIKQKAALRKAATDAMVRNAGDKYKPPTAAPNAGPGPAPPPEAVNDLRANPGTAAQFDEVFGPGAAARALGR